MDLKINPANLKTHVCECGNETFLPGGTLKLIPKIMSPSGQPEFLMIPGYVCTKCNTIQPPARIVIEKQNKLN